MPKATKDAPKKEKIDKRSSSTATKKVEKTTKKTSVSETKKKEASKNTSSKATVKATKTTKKASAESKVKSTKTVAKKSVPKTKSTKATSASTKTTTTKKTSSSRTKKATKKESFFAEYYDLPYRYNQTVVKVLAQTPQMLFVYWDISDEDRMQYTAKYGNDFFTKTRPVLVVHNETMDYTFEVEINDFANSWYLQVNHPNCKYVIELGRRPNLYQDSIKANYIYITSSNKIDAPNDHILFEEFNPNVTYKNVKTGEISTKDFSRLSNFKNMQNIYGIYDLYKKIYKNELFDEIVEGNLSNPSSHSSSHS